MKNLLLISLLLFGGSEYVIAGNFIVSPTRLDMFVAPGTSEQASVSLTNRTGAKATFILGAEDLIEGNYSLKNYIRSSDSEVTLNDGETRNIPVVITVPNGEASQGLYGNVTISLIPSESSNGPVGARIITRIAVAILVRTVEHPIVSGALSGFDTLNGNRIVWKSSTDFKIAYQNNGNVHMEPKGTITLSNLFGKTVIKEIITSFVVLPNSTRSVVLPVSGYLVGPYTATLNIDDGANTNKQTASIRVFFLPWPLLLILLTVIIILFLTKKMMKSSVTFLIVTFAICHLTFNMAEAYVASSTNYRIDRDSINFGGGLSTSTNYSQESTLGEVGTGRATSTSYRIEGGYQQTNTSISITSPSDVTLTPSIDGATGGTANGSANWVVVTDNSAGYSLTIFASAAPALVSGSNNFSDYTPASAVPDFAFAVSGGSSEFAFTPEGTDIVSTYKDNGSVCATGALDTESSCWASTTVAAKGIANSSSATPSTGSTTTVRFRASAGSTANQAAGTYVANITVTATAL